MSLDALTAKVLKESRARFITALADAYTNAQTRTEFKTMAAEAVDFFTSETREVSLKVTNSRTGKSETQRVDIVGIIPDSGDIDQIMRWGAWLYAKGWETTEFDSTVKLTRSQHSAPFQHVLSKVGKS